MSDYKGQEYENFVKGPRQLILRAYYSALGAECLVLMVRVTDLSRALPRLNSRFALVGSSLIATLKSSTALSYWPSLSYEMPL